MTLDDIAAQGKAAVAKMLTEIETRPDTPEIQALLHEAFATAKGASIGLTGPPGVGKSSLTEALINSFRSQGLSVAVIAVDPSSRRSGGALLGDRTRIETDPEDQQIFMRSMAARGTLGGVAEITFPAIVLLRALYDIVIVETVGVGQSEIEIAEQTDGVVFCVQPGSGDGLQFMKAGVMEIPDIIVVTKGDLGALASRAAADLAGAFSLDSRGESIPVLVVSSATGTGITELTEKIRDLIFVPVFQGSLASQRQSQGLSWARKRLSTYYGELGLSFVTQYLVDDISPFQSIPKIESQLTKAFEEGWRRLQKRDDTR